MTLANWPPVARLLAENVSEAWRAFVTSVNTYRQFKFGHFLKHWIN